MNAKSFLISVFTVMISLSLAVTATVAKEPERFTVTVTGHGPDVILIPGLASSAKVWDSTVKQLAVSHRVHAIQIAGFAGSPSGANGGNGGIVAPVVEELSDYATELEKPVIIGHSLGGLLALKLAAEKPDSVGRVLVVDSLSFYPLLFDRGATVDGVKSQAAAMRERLIAQSNEDRARFASLSVVRMVKSEMDRKAVAEWSAASDHKVVAQTLYEVMTTDLRPMLPNIKLPVTVLYAWDAGMGMSPQAVDGLYTSSYAGLAGVKLQRIDGAFHFIMLDQPEAFAKVVGEFVK